MFERKKPAPPQKRIDSLIGAGTTVRGDVVFTGGLRIDGTVEGNVATADGTDRHAGDQRAGAHRGEINVSHVVVNGTVNGPIAARDYLELQAKARVDGDVHVPHARDARRRRRAGPAATMPNRVPPTWSN